MRIDSNPMSGRRVEAGVVGGGKEKSKQLSRSIAWGGGALFSVGRGQLTCGE